MSERSSTRSRHALVVIAALAAELFAGERAHAADPTAADPKLVPPHSYTPPYVRTAPIPNAFMKNYPAQAWDAYVTGSAILMCTVRISGDPTACIVVSETPLNSGFGAAALALAPLYKFYPATMDGRPTAGEASFEVPFGQFGRPWLEGKAEVPVNHAWQTCQAPTPSIPRYYPSLAQQRNIEGRAEFECRLTSNNPKPKACAWTSETPPNYGFGEAATKIACQIFAFPAGPPQSTPQDWIYQGHTTFKLPPTSRPIPDWHQHHN